MSPEYNNVISSLKEHFKTMLDENPKWVCRLTRAEYVRGVDCLGEPFSGMIRETGKIWLIQHNYEVSYTQICRAFFNAVDELGKLEIY